MVLIVFLCVIKRFSFACKTVSIIRLLGWQLATGWGVINKVCAGCVLSNNSNKKKKKKIFIHYSTFVFQVFSSPLKRLTKKASTLKTALYAGILVLVCFVGMLDEERQLEHIHALRPEDPEEFNTKLCHVLLPYRSPGKPKISVKCVLKWVLKLVTIGIYMARFNN